MKAPLPLIWCGGKLSIFRKREERYDEVQAKRGRPAGKTSSNNIYRRTSQDISNDKIMVAQMKLNAMKESVALKLAK